MDLKEAMSILLLFILVFIGVAAMSASYGADLDVVRDFDNTTIYHTVKSDSGSQTVWGIENNAKLMSKDGKLMSNGVYEDDNGYYEYDGMYLNNTLLERNDRVYFKEPVSLTASYKYNPYMFAEIDVIDLHGHSSSSATYPAMKTMDDSITKTFKDFTDVETGYTPLYILDLGTNVKYQPGDNFTITYNDVLDTGLNRLIKTFQYVYAKDILIENVIVENRTVYNDSIINREVYNDTIIDRIIYNDTIINRVIFNDTIVDRIIYNDTVINRTIENITYVDKVIENITYVNKTIEIPFYKIIIIPKIINEVVNPIQNNNNTTQYNKTNPINYQNNNTTNLNNITNNINKENNTSTPISDKTINMKKTGNTFGLILLIILFVILLQLYNKEE